MSPINSDFGLFLLLHCILVECLFLLMQKFDSAFPL